MKGRIARSLAKEVACPSIAELRRLRPWRLAFADLEWCHRAGIDGQSTIEFSAKCAAPGGQSRYSGQASPFLSYRFVAGVRKKLEVNPASAWRDGARESCGDGTSHIVVTGKGKEGSRNESLFCVCSYKEVEKGKVRKEKNRFETSFLRVQSFLFSCEPWNSFEKE